jgi:hypothetical protein
MGLDFRMYAHGMRVSPRPRPRPEAGDENEARGPTVLTEFMSGIVGSVRRRLPLVHKNREYGLSFTRNPAHARKMFPRMGTLTKIVNMEVV